MCMKYFYVLISLFPFALQASQLDVAVSAESAILMNADTGCILFEKNSAQTHFPASITKVATALYTLKEKESCLDELITAEQEAVASISPTAKRKGNYKHPSHWIETGATHIGIKRGETFQLRDLLFAVLVSSANDASNVVAQYVGDGSIDRFMKSLNAYLRQLGCRDTNFLNPHGLHHPDHKTSARDMAIIAREALKNNVFREIVSSKNYTCPETNKQPSRTLVQTNQLLKKGTFSFSKAIGVKTGYTSDAGHTLVAAAKQEDRTLIAIVLNCNERKDAYNDVLSLFNTAFVEEKMTKRVLKKGLQKYNLSIEGASSMLQTHLAEDVEVSYYPSEEEPIQASLQWKESFTLPILENTKVGTLLLLGAEERVIGEVSLLAYNKVKPTLYYSVKQKMKGLFAKKWIVPTSLIAGIVFMLFGGALWLRSRKKTA